MLGESLEKAKNQIWISGGIGVTPFLSMARSLEKESAKIKMYYCTNTKEEAIFVEELKEIAKKSANFKIKTWFSNETGKINGDMIVKSEGKDNLFLICGPPAMMNAVSEQLVNQGVPKNNIKMENFGFK